LASTARALEDDHRPVRAFRAAGVTFSSSSSRATSERFAQIYDGFSRNTIGAFKHVLDRARLPSTVRLTRGRDIAAACGQLAATRSLP